MLLCLKNKSRCVYLARWSNIGVQDCPSWKDSDRESTACEASVISPRKCPGDPVAGGTALRLENGGRTGRGEVGNLH